MCLSLSIPTSKKTKKRDGKEKHEEFMSSRVELLSHWRWEEIVGAPFKGEGFDPRFALSLSLSCEKSTIFIV